MAENEERHEQRGGERGGGDRGGGGRDMRGRDDRDDRRGGGRDDRGGGGGRGRGPGGPGGPGGRRFRRRRGKVCQFCVEKTVYVDYKELDRLRRYITDRGKILPRRISGNCSRHQRMLSTAIKRARNIALIPFKAV